MPKKHGLPKNLYAQLERTAQRADLTILGGMRQLGLYLREDNETFQPQIAIWLDARNGAVLTSNVLNPLGKRDSGRSEALETLAMALIQAPPTPLIIDNPQADVSEAGEGKKSREAPPPFQPGLPATLVINDEELVQAAEEIFVPLGVTVAYQPDIPAFEAAFQALSQQLGASADAKAPEPFAWDMPQALLTPLYAAAAGLWRREPWTYMPDHPPLVIALGDQGPRQNVPTLYASILGGGGMEAGAAFYYSREAYERFLQHSREMQANNPFIDQAIDMLRKAGVPVDQIPPDEVRMVLSQLLGGNAPADEQEMWNITEEGFVCFFESKEECDPTYLDWMAAHGLKPPSREGVPTFLKTLPGQEPQELGDEREVTAMTHALEALNQFFSHMRSTLEGPLTLNETLTHKARVSGSVVEVSFTPTEDLLADWIDDDDLEEPDEPASEAALTTVYRFQVRLAETPAVWRRIEMRGDQTLHHLHAVILEAFEWDDNQGYTFFLSGKAGDAETAYQSPGLLDGERSAAKYRLERLSLKPGQQMLYLMDEEGSPDVHVKLETIIPGGAKPGGDYPQITEQQGDAPPLD